MIREELLDHEFLGIEAFSSELPDDEFGPAIERIMKDDPEAIFSNTRPVVNGIVATREGIIDITKEPFSLVYGARDVLPPSQQILPSFGGAIATMEFIFAWFEDEKTPFPLIPVADISVPHNLLENTYHQMDLEVHMHKKGAVLYDPSYDVKSKESLSVDVVDRDTPLDEFLEIIKDRFLFSSRHGNVLPEFEDNCNWISMTFNPTHPMAVPYIIDVEKVYYQEEGEKHIGYKGSYRWGRRIRSFNYSMNDKRYRVHSDVWIKLFGPNYHYMACFDMVSNFDFLEILSPEKVGFRKVSINSELMIEPYSVMGPIHTMYSPMMCARVESTMKYGSGMSTGVLLDDKFNSKQDVGEILKDWKREREKRGNDYVYCKDVTKDYVLYIDSIKGHIIIHVATGKEVYVVSPKDNLYKKNLGLQRFSSLFFEYSFRSGLTKVLQVESGEDVSHLIRKIYVKGGFFFGAPRSDFGCLIDPLVHISLLDALELSKKDKDGYLPFAAKMPALVQVFETFSPLLEDIEIDEENDQYRWEDEGHYDDD